jgi:hypothetical protein
MNMNEAREVAANPSSNLLKLRLARLKLGNAALRAFPSSQKQKEIQALVKQIEAMPREYWTL